MSKILLICPANISQMPYLNGYVRVLKEVHCQYETLVWDRLRETESVSDYIYKDDKISHSRGFFDYWKFSKFVKNILITNKFDKIIVFGIPLAYFLSSFLTKNYASKYVFDLRDHHTLRYVFFRFNYMLNHSFMNVVSSRGYLSWLPKNIKYVVNHNTIYEGLEVAELEGFIKVNKKVVVSCIGSLKDFKINESILKVANEIPNCEFVFNYHGDGIINDDLVRLSLDLNNLSINVTGRYDSKDESLLYKSSDFINMFMSIDSLNNRTCLSNRLYNAVLNGIPLLVLKGSYLSDLIENYNLGVIFTDVEDFYLNFITKTNNFDLKAYNHGRVTFFKDVKVDNLEFKKIFSFFIES